MKLVFPYRGGLVNGPVGSDRRQANPENSLWVLGISDQPWMVDHDGAFGTLAAEFHPGAYRFFPFPLNEAQNEVVDVGSALGAWGQTWQERLIDEPTAEAKAARLQKLLLALLDRHERTDELVDDAVALIRRRRGLISVAELAERTGYSARWLAARFEQGVGLAPKTLAEIVRFQSQFRYLTRWGGSKVDFDGYYDQPHFTRQFKRFAGLPPAAYARARNEFGNLFQTASDSYKTP